MSTLLPAKPVVVTRAEGSDGPLSRELRELGLKVLTWPAVRVTPADPSALIAALAAVRSFGWIVFASRHAVAAVLERLPHAPAGVRIAAVGQATAQVLRQRGWPVHLLPEEPSAAGLIDAFAAQWSKADEGVQVLYPALLILSLVNIAYKLWGFDKVKFPVTAAFGLSLLLSL